MTNLITRKWSFSGVNSFMFHERTFGFNLFVTIRTWKYWIPWNKNNMINLLFWHSIQHTWNYNCVIVVFKSSSGMDKNFYFHIQELNWPDDCPKWTVARNVNHRHRRIRARSPNILISLSKLISITVWWHLRTSWNTII